MTLPGSNAVAKLRQLKTVLVTFADDPLKIGLRVAQTPARWRAAKTDLVSAQPALSNWRLPASGACRSQ
jgi:hypothetical protein